MVNFLGATRKFKLAQTVPLTVWIGRVLLNVEFYLPGNYHPVLPYKTNSKLMFHLCSACADTMNQDDCTHSDKERCIVGTWVVDEVRKAEEIGYKVMDVYEFSKYKVTCFDKDTNSGLFAEYVNMFLTQTGIIRLSIMGSE
jgi:hypothetical protein